MHAPIHLAVLFLSATALGARTSGGLAVSSLVRSINGATSSMSSGDNDCPPDASGNINVSASGTVTYCNGTPISSGAAATTTGGVISQKSGNSQTFGTEPSAGNIIGQTLRPGESISAPGTTIVSSAGGVTSQNVGNSQTFGTGASATSRISSAAASSASSSSRSGNAAPVMTAAPMLMGAVAGMAAFAL